MRAVIQRVSSARVTVDGAVVGAVGAGLLGHRLPSITSRYINPESGDLLRSADLYCEAFERALTEWVAQHRQVWLQTRRALAGD